MRLLKFIPAAVALAVAVPAHAEWAEYTDRAQHFTVNFPNDPVVESIMYKTAKGTMLPAKLYSAKDARGGAYSIRVVDYSSAPGEIGTAVLEAAAAERARGDLKYDAKEHQNNMISQRTSVSLPDGRFLLTETLADHGRLFTLEAQTPPKVPPPSQFQASLQVLDDTGKAIRYKSPGSEERVR